MARDFSSIALSINSSKLTTLIKDGAVGVMPTDTIYGVVCSASSPDAVARLYNIKRRENKPGTVIAASVDQLVQLGIKRRYLKAVEHFWPNPISLVLPVGHELDYLDAGKLSVAVRIPADVEIRKLLEQTGPLLTSSVNITGQPPANNIDEAKAYFASSVDFYVDGGDKSEAEASTVIRVVDDAIEVLRQGAVEVTESGSIKNKSDD